ncbi:MAG TPA: alpha/beta hydrolase [Mycobacteriales bacterium]|nr:alpha/beta hydrolase [Mycobacteriales bacterium]
MHSRTATVDGTPVRWLEQGAGTPVVLVHGIPTSPALWRHVLPLLPDLRVLAFEMTGYGESIPAGQGRDISVSAQADRLNAWIEHLDLGPVTLVGHDLGGGVVHIAAVRRPDLCAGILITNGIGYDSWPIPSVKAMRATAPLLARLPALALKPAFGVLLARGHDDVAKAKEALGVHHRPYAAHGGGAAMARQVAALDVRDTIAVQGRLPGLGKPARVVWGVADQFQKVEYGERFARDLGTPLRRIEGGKHFTPEDHPGILAEEIRSLAAEVAGR